MTPEQRILRSKMGGYALVAKHGGAAPAARSRRGFMVKFEREVDPDNELPAEERRKRADAAMRKHMAGMALKRLAQHAR